MAQFGRSNHSPTTIMHAKDPILVVEDEPAIAESVSYALRKAGFSAVTATDLQSAIPQAPHATLVILDLMLPDGNGRELLEQMRARGQTTPIIVLSSRDSEEDRVGALEAGADDYITKPFSPRGNRRASARCAPTLWPRGHTHFRAPPMPSPPNCKSIKARGESFWVSTNWISRESSSTCSLN